MTDFPETNRFPLTITKEMMKDSIFLKQKMTERCNVGMLLGVIKREEGQDLHWDEWESFTYKNENPMFKDYYKTFDEEEFHTSYYLPKHKFGRCNPKGWLSLSVFRRVLRHSFAKGIYKDIDMKNAHPVILSIILTQHNIPCEKLAEYAMNPAEIRQDIMAFYNISKDEAKKLIFRMCYGGSYTNWCQERGEDRIHPFLLALEKELTNIQIMIHTNNKETIVKEVKKQDPTKWNNEYKERRGVMGLYAQSVERLIQEKAIAWLVSNKGLPLEKIIPSQDGFMILEEYWYDGLTDDINKVIKDEMNIPIEFIVKPFDEAIEIEEWAGKTYPEWVDDLSSKKLADRFLKEFGNNICMYQQQQSHSIYVFDGKRWFDETDEKSRHKITILLSEKLYDIIKDELDNDCGVTPKQHFTLANSLRNNTSTKSNFTNFYIHLLASVRRIPDDFNSDPNLIGFNNGVYDLVKSEFRPYTFDDYITLSTSYDYAECDPVKKAELLGIFNTIQDDPEKYGAYMRILASGLDGINYQNLFLFNGTGGNGKGFTSRLLKWTLGDYYLEDTNDMIQDSVKGGSASPNMFKLKNKRMVIFPEVEGTIKNGILKIMTGGDTITARMLHKNPESFSLNGSFILYFNKAPELDTKCGKSESRRIVDVDFPYNFTEKPEELALGKPYIQGNSEYILPEWNRSHRLEMLHILLDVYKEHKKEAGGIDLKIPQSILKRTETFIENQNPFVKIIAQNYTVDTAMTVPKEEKEFKKLKGTGFAKIWGEVKMTEEYKNMTTRQRKEYSRDELYEYLRKNKQFITHTSAQDVSSIYNLTRINMYEPEPVEKDPEAEYKA
jgi:hypothetical protein